MADKRTALHKFTGDGAQYVTLQGVSTLDDSVQIGVKVAPDGGICTNQNILVNAANSSTTNLASGATFTGTVDLNIFASGIQVLLKSDQNCTVYVDQSGDGTNWDVTDAYDFYAAVGNFGITVMCVGVYYRVRVTNVGTATTTYFRLQTISVPFVSPLPRSLNVHGELQTVVNAIRDHNGFEVDVTPQKELMVASHYLLVGGTFTGGVIDTNFWTTSLGTGGSVAPDGQITISTGTTANNSVSVQSVRTARYVAGLSNEFKCDARMPDNGTANNTRRLGAFTTTDGAFFELNGTTFRLATRRASTTTYVDNGSFNGHHGATHAMDFNVAHEFEIKWSTKSVYFFLDGHVIHTVSASTAPWSDNLHLPVRLENFNSGGSATNVALEVRTGTITRAGIPQTQPARVFSQRAGTDVTDVVKYGPGGLHGVVLSGITNNAVVTLYDNIAASGTVIWTSGPLTANGLPFEIDMKDIAFSTGLTVYLTGANLNVLTMYE